MAAADRFFEKVLNDVLTATEQISEKLEEGLSAVWKGLQNDDNQENRNDAQPSHDPVTESDLDGGDDDEWLRESPLQGIAESVVGDIVGKQIGPQTPWENWQAFKSAITWTEPFIIALILVQVFMLVMTVSVSRNGRALGPRIVVMILIGSIVKSSEYMNRIAGLNWQRFSTQNYFDKRGVFMSIFVCAPLLLDSMIMLLLFLREAQQLLVQVKTKQLKRKPNKQSKSQPTRETAKDKNQTQKKKQ